jgi:hypothetical protein
MADAIFCLIQCQKKAVSDKNWSYCREKKQGKAFTARFAQDAKDAKK